MEVSHQPHQRPTSARTLAERVTLYCRQTTASHNAAMVRSVVKPTAAEMTEYIRTRGPQVYVDPTLVRVLLTDGDYDDVCREHLSLNEAVAWRKHSARERPTDCGDDESVLPLERSSSVLHVMLQSMHIFSEGQIKAAQEELASHGIVELRSVSQAECVPTDRCTDDSDPSSCESVDDISESGDEEDESSGDDCASEETDKGETEIEDSKSGQSETNDHIPEGGRNRDQELPKEKEIFSERGEGMLAISGVMSPEEPTNITDEGNPSTEEGDKLVEVEKAAKRESSAALRECEVGGEEADARIQSVTIAKDDVSVLIFALLEEMLGEVETTTVLGEETERDHSKEPPEIGSEPTMHEDSGVPEGYGKVCDEPSINETTLVARLVKAVDVEMQKDGAELDGDERAIEEDAAVLHRRFSSYVGPHITVSDSRDHGPETRAHDSTIVVSDSPPITRPAYHGTIASLAPAEDEDAAFRADLVAIHVQADQSAPTYSVTETPCQTQGQEITFSIPRDQQPVVVGDPVEAQYRGWSQFHAGEIVQAHENGTYAIRYADGDHEEGVNAELIRRRSRGECTVSSSESFLPPGVGILGTIAEPVVVLDVDPLESAANRKEANDTAVGGDRREEMKDELRSDTSPENPRGPDVAFATSPLIAGSQEETRTTRTEEIPSAIMQKIGSDSVSMETDEEEPRLPRRNYRVGDRVRVSQAARRGLLGWIVGVRQTDGEEVYDVLYDRAVEGSVGAQKEMRVRGDRIERLDGEQLDSVVDDGEGGTTQQKADTTSNQHTHRAESTVETTPVLPFKRQKSKVDSLPPEIEAAHAIAFENVEEDGEMTTRRSHRGSTASDSEEDYDVCEDVRDDEEFRAAVRLVGGVSNKSEATPLRPLTASMQKQGRTPRKSKSTAMKSASFRRDRQAEQPVELSEATMRYLTPKTRKQLTVPITRPKTGSQATPRSQSKPKRPTADTVSWKELEEWKNVDMILTRKRRVVNHGQIEGSDVPWGEEFAAIQSLKRFATQYPDVLRQHIECQLCEVVNSTISGVHTARPMTSTTTSAARDALYLIKDLAFLLRQRLSPFLDVILPVVLPAVFHSQKRFLCETAYEVLEALVTHCSCRKLVVALLRQALRFPRGDLRLVNLTCLYVEKCLQVLSFAVVQELMTHSAGFLLEATAELLTCKSAACQSSLQKSLWAIKQAIGEEMMERLLHAHLMGNALVTVRRHLQAAEASTLGGGNRSPQASPTKGAVATGTPVKSAGPAARAAQTPSTGGLSILQRMVAQRQNRVVPAPE